MNDPIWTAWTRKRIGLREIKGPNHAPGILAAIKRVGARRLGITVKDDETAWCGTEMADAMVAAGIEPPSIAVRAKSWATWGIPVTPRLGAILVFGRDGGGHVGQYVGEDKTRFYVLGGNQSNMVNIMPIGKARLIACRWPEGIPADTRPVLMTLAMAASQNEA